MFKESVKSMRNRTVRLDREGDYWNEEEKTQLVNMFHEGIGITAMAIQLQRTEPAIIQQIEKLDLYNRKEAPSRRRSSLKESVCLCSVCRLDPALCANRRACQFTQEGKSCLKNTQIS